MNQRPDCDVFQDQLDALLDEKLPEAGLEQLRLHAASCPGCAMQLRVHRHLVTRSLSDLEADVPAEVLGSVWPRVQADIAVSRSSRWSVPIPWHGWNRLVPVLAAATLLLCIGTGLLYRRVVQLHERETALVQQIAEQDRRLAQLATGMSMDPVARAARLAGRAVWERALERRNSVSVSEIEAMLSSLPAQATMFDAGASEVLARRIPFWSATAAEAALSGIDSADGIQAGELLQVLAALDINPDRRIATARILGLYRRETLPGRS
ncbi:MAG: zf-HC2 domain-containing protein [Gemmatimonadota bacterium]|nr:MAG: zf-HC2 domain-containing protein [Gemmatimonadota bacterium]